MTAQEVQQILVPYLLAIGLAVMVFVGVAAFAWRDGRRAREREGPGR